MNCKLWNTCYQIILLAHPLAWQHRWLRSLVVGLINDPVLLLPVFLGLPPGNGWPTAACFRLFLASPLAPFDGLCFPFYFFLASPLAQLILPFPLRPFSLVFLFAFKLRTPLSHKKQHVEYCGKWCRQFVGNVSLCASYYEGYCQFSTEYRGFWRIEKTFCKSQQRKINISLITEKEPTREEQEQHHVFLYSKTFAGALNCVFI